MHFILVIFYLFHYKSTVSIATCVSILDHLVISAVFPGIRFKTTGVVTIAALKHSNERFSS